MSKNKPIFRQLDADDAEPEATEIESLCMNCHKDGKTRILLTKIPHYKDLVLMSFSCEHCGYENNEIQSGGPVSEKAVQITLCVETLPDLNRQVVKSDYTSIKIPELDFEIPSKSQKGGVTTVEGLIDRSISGLEQDQEARREQHPEAAEQIDDFIRKLKELKELPEPFTLILEDISGNSYIENPNAPKKDSRCSVRYFKRNKEQDHELGIFTRDEIGNENEDALLHPISEVDFKLEDLQNEVLQFPTNCNNCGSPCETNMKVTKIPHFKEVVIMATNCDVCGNRTNEVKSGGGIEKNGLHIEIDVKSKEDFSRDVLKAETCYLSIPELELEVGPSALGGRFTTVEGLLMAVKEQLQDGNLSHLIGDSQDDSTRKRFESFIERFEDVLNGSKPVTVILDDPAGNSYIQNLSNDDDLDENLRINHYERTFEQNEELGLNDMKTENYE